MKGVRPAIGKRFSPNRSSARAAAALVSPFMGGVTSLFAPTVSAIPTPNIQMRPKRRLVVPDIDTNGIATL